MYTDKSAKDLGGEDGGLYYPLNAALMPEAFQDFYKGTISEKGGCKGLQVRSDLHVFYMFGSRDEDNRIHA